MAADTGSAWEPMTYMRDSVATLAGLGARAGAQALLVVLLARRLGPEAYGQLVAAVAIGGFLVPLANLGLPGALLRDLARCDAAEALRRTGEAVGLWLCAGLVAAAVSAILASTALRGPLAVWAIGALAFGETVSASGAELYARAYQGRRRLARFGLVMFSLPGARALAVGTCALLGVEGAEAWVLAFAAAGVLPVAWLAAASPRALRVPWRRWLALASEGRPFALSALAVRLQGELNKPLLAQLSYASAGHFGLAQRIVDLALLPLLALVESLLPRVYAERREPLARLRRAGAALLLAALALGAGLAAAGPWMLPLFGPGYAEAAWMLAALAAYPALHLATILGNVALVATGNAGRLPRVVLGGGAAGTAAAVILIPWLGAPGAILALYAGRVAALLLQAAAFLKARSGMDKP